MRKKKLITIVLVLLMIATGLSAQNQVNTLTVDAETYALYEKKEWKKLIEVGKNSLEHGIDFYYLQYRMGTAYYELKNYRNAVRFFEKVVKETPDDKIALEYLYYSYLFSGMYEDARLFGRKLPDDMKEKLNLPEEGLLINGAGAEFKYYIVDDYQAEAGEGDYLYQKSLRNLWYANINLTSYTKGKLTIFQGFSYLAGKNIVSDPSYSDTAFNENIKQFQYYLSGNVLLSKATNLKIAVNYTNTGLTGINPENSHGQGQSKYFYKDKLNGIAGFAKLKKSIAGFDIKVTATLSYFDPNTGTQFLPGIGVRWYPFGNTGLYANAEVSYIIANKTPDYDPGFIFKSNVGIRLFKSMWIEPFMLYGKSRNFVDDDAFVTYNSINTVNYWYGVNLNTLISKGKIILYFNWQQYSLTNDYTLNTEKQSMGFLMSTFLGGTKFRF